jgi:hypothetical protein
MGLLLLAMVVSAAVALAAGGYDIPWWSVDGGGGTSSGGTYTLRGTAGQPDAGTVSGAKYAIAGGFWAGTGGEPPEPFKIVLPLVMRGQ